MAIQLIVMKYLIKKTLVKFVKDVVAHVRAGGWDQKVPKVDTKYNYKSRFDHDKKEPNK